MVLWVGVCCVVFCSVVDLCVKSGVRNVVLRGGVRCVMLSLCRFVRDVLSCNVVGFCVVLWCVFF